MRILRYEIEHHAAYPWQLVQGRICHLRLRTGEALQSAAVLYGDPFWFSGAEKQPVLARSEMQPALRCSGEQYYSVSVPMRTHKLRYHFVLTLEDGSTVYLSELGVTPPLPESVLRPFNVPYVYAGDHPAPPDWAEGFLWYQIFPDRFRRVDVPGEEAVEPWGSKRVANEYRFGGNLKGILEAVPYLAELGVGVVYMTPIFLSDTSHRYNTFDYYQIDPLLGSLEDLRNLADALHARNIRIVLDGVFNHCGLGFAPFRDAMEKGKASEYYDWFFFGAQYPCGYMTFGEKWAYMPKLNMQNEACAAYFLDVGRYWLREAHVDGWRLDVSPEVYPDFWRQFRRAVLQTKPDAIMIAECWHDSREWCTVGDMFDGTMHYVLSEAIWKFFAERRWSLAEFDAGVNRAMMLYPQEVQNSMWNFLSSHDTARMLTRCGGRVKAMRAAVFFQMTHPGVPVIYYGDELAMRGGPDPDCRRSMTWDKVDGNAMLAYYKRLTHMRGESEVLREGTLRTWEVGEDGLYAYLRQTERETVLCALNTSERAIRRMIRLPEALAGCKAVRDLMTGKTHNVQGGYVTLALGACEGAVLGRAEA